MLDIQEIKAEVGFTEIKLNEAELVTESDIIIHIINTEEIMSVLNTFSSNILELETKYRDLLEHTVNHLRHVVQTIIPKERRSKRGLFNAVGMASKWIFGTMDDQDRVKIEQSLQDLSSNSHQLEINSLQQIRINDQFNKTFNQIKQIIEQDRILISTQLDSIQKRGLQENLYLDQLFKIQLLKDKIEHILENIASARHGIFHPNILTDEEIKEYNIDFHKLQYVKLGAAKFENSLIIFAIKIPKEFETIQLRMIMPMPNKNFKEIFGDNEIVFEYKNQMYKYENLKTLNELSLSKNCIFSNNCNLIRNNKTEIIEIDQETIVIKNAVKLMINQTCDDRNLTINNNVLIHYNNCTIKILGHKFSNVKAVLHERFYYPKSQNFSNFSTKLTFEDIILESEKNLNKIEHLDQHKNISYVMDVLIIVAFIAFVIIFIKNKIKVLYRIRENSNLKEGAVMYTTPRAVENHVKVPHLEPANAGTLHSSDLQPTELKIDELLRQLELPSSQCVSHHDNMETAPH